MFALISPFSSDIEMFSYIELAFQTMGFGCFFLEWKADVLLCDFEDYAVITRISMVNTNWQLQRNMCSLMKKLVY